MIPAGHYLVRALLEPDFETGLVARDAAKWQPVKREVDVTGDSEVVLKLVPSR
jgi:hypothetical protein